MLQYPKAILFDFGGTLFDDELDVLAGERRMLELAEPHRVGLQDYAAVARELDDDLIARRDAVQLEYPSRAFRRLISDRLGLRYLQGEATLELEFWRAAETCRIRTGARTVVKALRSRGIRLAVVSNMTFSHSVIEYELEREGLLGEFEAIVTSADYCVRKPHPFIFLGALGCLGVEARDAWYVGDRLDVDVVGASQVGMQTIWVNSARESTYEDIVPSAEIESLSDLLERLGAAKQGRG